MPDPQDLELEKAKEKLKTNQDAITGLQQENLGIQAQIKTLEAKRAEIQKATDGYDKAAADMKQELDAQKAAVGKKRGIAEFAIKDLKDQLDQKILDFDKALADQGKTVAAAADTAATAVAAVEKATQEARDKQAEYTTLQNVPKSVGSKLTELKLLVDEVAKAEAQDDFVAMYFYLREAALQADGIVIPTPEDYKKQLVASQAEIEAANIATAAKKADSNKAAAVAADAKKALDSALTSRRLNLLKVLHEVKAPVPAPLC
jgi:hypothetical protein